MGKSEGPIDLRRALPFVVAAALLYLPASVSTWLRPEQYQPAFQVLNWLLMLGGLSILVARFVRRRLVFTAVAIMFSAVELTALFFTARVLNESEWFIPIVERLPIEVGLFLAVILGTGWWLPLLWIFLAGMWEVASAPRGKESDDDSDESMDAPHGPQLTSASS